MIRPLPLLALAAALLLTPELCAAEKPTPKEPTSTASAKEITPPTGFWTHGKSGLYFTSEAAEPEISEGIIVGKRALQIGGPPPTQGRADDVFLPTKHERRGNSIVATGTFNWDADSHPIELEITWTPKSVTIKVLKNDGYTPFPVGTYELKKKRSS